MNDVDDALAATDRIGSYKQPTVGEWAAVRLADEVRTLRTQVSRLESDNAAMVRHLDALEDPEVADNEVAHLRARVAELERQHPTGADACTGCEGWGVEETPAVRDWDGAFVEPPGQGPCGQCLGSGMRGVQELVAQQGEPTDAEWGVRLIADERGDVAPRGLAELEAREIVERGGPQLWELVARTAAGPWRVQS